MLNKNTLLIFLAFTALVFTSLLGQNHTAIIGYTNDGKAIICEDEIVQESGCESLRMGEAVRDDYQTMLTFNNTIPLNSGWNVVGISNVIEDVRLFLGTSCILSARKYVDGVWQEYNALNDTNAIESLQPHDGLFVYTNGECELNNYGTRVFDKNELMIQAVVSNEEVPSEELEIAQEEAQEGAVEIAEELEELEVEQEEIIPTTDEPLQDIISDENNETNTTQELT